MFSYVQYLHTRNMESVGEGVMSDLKPGDSVPFVFTERYSYKIKESNICDLLMINTHICVMLSDRKTYY
ncbi:hypothetical protein PTKIN_Ptkin11bG0098200 [Pterospermum kingtungense]